MSGAFSEHSVTLARDALKTPWGFRLQGGTDFKIPLTVQRVFVGSPADGDLHRGDIILYIDNHDARQLSHKQAQDIIKNAGGAIHLVLKGCPRAASAGGFSSGPSPAKSPSLLAQGYRSRPLDTFTPKPDPPLGGFSPKANPQMAQYNMGVDYGHAGPGHHGGQDPMLSRVQNSLNDALWTPRVEEGDPDYQPKSIHDLKTIFTPTHQATQRGTPRTYIVEAEVAEEEEEQQRPSVRELMQKFKGPRPGRPTRQHQPAQSRQPAQQHHHQPAHQLQQQPAHHHQQQPAQQQSSRRTPWRKPDAGYGPAALSEPGWTAKAANERAPTHTHQRYVPPPVNREPSAPLSQQSHLRPHQEIHHQQPSSPAWAGTLRSSGGEKAWENQAHEHLVPGGTGRGGEGRRSRGEEVAAAALPVHSPRVQNVHYGPGDQAPQYQQHSADQGGHDNAVVAHAQYNTPIGLYSKENVQKELTHQTGGKPGEGTMQVLGSSTHYASEAGSGFTEMGVDYSRPSRPRYDPPQSSQPTPPSRTPPEHTALGSHPVAHASAAQSPPLPQPSYLPDYQRGVRSLAEYRSDMDSRVSGGPGKTFNAAQSDVYRMIQEEEGKPRGHGLRGGGGGGHGGGQGQASEQSARYQEAAPGQEMQYQGFQDHSYQSPSMQALEHNMGVGFTEQDMAASDF